jgi:hypothetical protein
LRKRKGSNRDSSRFWKDPWYCYNFWGNYRDWNLRWDNGYFLEAGFLICLYLAFPHLI